MGFVELYTGFFELLGLHSSWKRLLFGSLAGFGGQLLLKPSISYRKDGSAKAIGETLFPWWAWVIVPGGVFALFF
jgi:hypothetical protein